MRKRVLDDFDHRCVIVMVLVVAAEHITIETRPALVTVIRWIRPKSVASRTDPNQWLARSQVRSDQFHHFIWRSAAPHADEEQVGIFDNGEVGEKVIMFF